MRQGLTLIKTYPSRTPLPCLGCLFLLSFFLLCSCSSTALVERSGHGQALQQREVSVRRVSVAILSPDPRHFHDMTELVAEASRQLYQEAGITLYVKGYQNISWLSSDRAGMLQQVADQMKNVAEPYDIPWHTHPCLLGRASLSPFLAGGKGSSMTYTVDILC